MTVQTILKAAAAAGMAHNSGVGGEFILVGTGPQLEALERALQARAPKSPQMDPQAAREAPNDGFNGDTLHLINCMRALVNLNDAGALAPHGIGGHARTLLLAAAARLDLADRVAPSRVPPGWKIERRDSKPFKVLNITAPNGYSSSVGSHERNPMNVLYMLAEALLAADEVGVIGTLKASHAGGNSDGN